MMNKSIVEEFVNKDVFEKIIQYLEANNCSGIPLFKDNYLKRRIYLRAKALKFNDINDYYVYLKSNKDEIKVFDDIITINVTYFFRHQETYDTLKEKVLSEIFERKSKKGESFLKILFVGCASGEEVYSLAMILQEHFSKEILFIKPYMLGIDYDNNSIMKARIGVYDKQELTNVPSEFIKKYFEPLDSRKFIISPQIKKMVVFRHEDFFKSDIKRYWDIIFCRNMLIYLNGEAQEELIRKLYNLCIDGGYLVLGKSETLTGNSRKFFSSAFIKERIFKKRRAYES
jgi:chemotaxis protein methyltransferase CheR